MSAFRSADGMGTVSVSRERKPSFLGIHAINVFVRDQDRSLRFYVDQLGFHLAFDARLQSGERWVAVAPPDGSAVLSLVTPLPDSRAEKLIGRPTGIVFVTEDVIAKFDEWRGRGVRFSFAPRLRRVKYERAAAAPDSSGTAATPEDRSPVWGGVFTRFRDPDGNSFALVGFDEVNREIEAQRRQIAEKMEAEHRAAQEMEIAKQVQVRLLPQRRPPIGSLEYAGACIPARQVGGDYYDFLDLGRDRFGLVIADISGKGMPAALLMANLQANIRSQCASAVDEPGRFLHSVNQLFYENTDDSSYATLFFAEYDAPMQRLRYANCGHLAGLLVRREGGIERLGSTCTVLGIFKTWHCAIAEQRLFPEDMLVLYTDGVTESFNDSGEEFGEQRLIETLERRRGAPPQAVIASIVEDIQQFSSQEQHDDITLIVARCRGDGEAGD